MAKNGRIQAENVNAIAYRLEVDVTKSVTWSGYSTSESASYGAYLTTYSTPDILNLASGIQIAITSTKSGGTESYAIDVITPGGTWSDAGSSWLSSAQIEARLLIDSVYCLDTGALLKLEVSGTEVYKGGVLQTTIGGFDATSGGCGPSWLPIIGVPPQITADTPQASPGTPPLTGDFTNNGSITVDILGGWRFRENSTWIDLPVNVPDHSVSVGLSTLGTNPAGFVSGSDTWEIHCLQHFSASAGRVSGVALDTVQEGKDSTCWIWPELPRSFENFASGAKEIMVRFDFPNVTANRNQVQTDINVKPPSFAQQTFNFSLYASKASAVFVNGDTTHTKISEVMTADTPTLVFARHTKSLNGVTNTAVYDAPNATTTVSSYLAHNVEEARIYNTWFNPHWSYADYGENWAVDGAAVDFHDYWFPIRDQWQESGFLASGERTEKRTSIIGSCLDDSSHTPFMDTAILGHRWAGISRYKTKEITLKTSHTYDADSSSLFSIDAGSLSFGSTIEITFGGSPAEISLDLLSFATEPYMWPSIATHITQDWVATNVVSIQVFIESVNGTRKQIPLSKNVKTEIPHGSDTKYAGSWAIDNGNGAVTDTGSDDLPSGVSTATMSNAERVSSFGLLADGSASKLVFIVTPVSTGTVVDLEYPTLHFEPTGSDEPLWIWESGQCATLLVPNGAGVRFGNNYHWDGATLNATPTPTGLGYKATVIDALCFHRLYLEGKAHNDGLTTELATLYDSFEGQSVAQVDPDSMGFPLPNQDSTTQRFVLAQSVAEVPPLALLPWRSRTSPEYVADGATWVLASWLWSQEARRIISPDPTLVSINDDLGSPVGAEISTIDGWRIWEYSPVVDNTETDWKIVKNGVDYATVRPWHGWYANILYDASPSLVYDVLQNWRHAIGEIIDGTIWLSFSESNKPYVFNSVDTGTSAESLDISYLDGTASLYYLAISSGSIELHKTNNEGQSSTYIMTIGTGDFSAMDWTKNNLCFIYRLDGSGDIYCQVIDANETTVIAEAITNITGIDQGQIEVRSSVNADQTQVIGITFKQGGNRMFKTSPDGFTFS